MSGSPIDCAALYAALDERRTELSHEYCSRVSWRQVCRQAGCPAPSLIVRLRQDEPPNLENFIRLLLWLGETDMKPYLRSRP